MVSENGRYVLIASDAAYGPYNWQGMEPCGLAANGKLQTRTLKWISEVAGDPACVSVLCNHDPNERPRLIEW